jgi:hypothetical protein
VLLVTGFQRNYPGRIRNSFPAAAGPVIQMTPMAFTKGYFGPARTGT